MSRFEPDLGLEHVSNKIAMEQHRAFSDACRAAGVLQKSNVLGGHFCFVVVQPRTRRQHSIEALMPRQIPRGHHVLHVSHDKVDQQPLRTQSVAHSRDHDVFDGRVLHDCLQHRRKVFQDNDDFRAGVLQLVFEFTRRVERVDIDDDGARAQHR
jgi:hypothetical protein